CRYWQSALLGNLAAQECQRAPSGFDGVVAVTAQLNVDAARVTDLPQCSQRFGEIDLALTEHQMIVDAAPHVLDMDVPQPVAPATQVRSDRHFSQTMQMANIDG